MGAPLAYLLTWTTYGSWLHGDPRGSVDRQHNKLGEPLRQPSELLQHASLGRLRWPPLVLGEAARGVVHRAITDHSVLRTWTVLALNVRTTHVHVVVAAPGPPEPVLQQFKSWATRRLRESRLIEPNRAVWTDHGSTRYLNSPESVARAVHYVLYGQ